MCWHVQGYSNSKASWQMEQVCLSLFTAISEAAAAQLDCIWCSSIKLCSLQRSMTSDLRQKGQSSVLAFPVKVAFLRSTKKSKTPSSVCRITMSATCSGLSQRFKTFVSRLLIWSPQTESLPRRNCSMLPGILWRRSIGEMNSENVKF